LSILSIRPLPKRNPRENEEHNTNLFL
jgi:hypothetical protein